MEAREAGISDIFICNPLTSSVNEIFVHVFLFVGGNPHEFRRVFERQ